MKQLITGLLLALVLVGCAAKPQQGQIACHGKNYTVTYMSEMQQYEVERFALRNEFKPGCVANKLKQIKAQTCHTPSTMSYQQWMSLYSSCRVEKP